MEPAEVQAHLEAAGVHVHLATRTATGDVVVFLEANRGEHEQARAAARRIPGAGPVVFAPHTNAIMYVAAQ